MRATRETTSQFEERGLDRRTFLRWAGAAGALLTPTCLGGVERDRRELSGRPSNRNLPTPDFSLHNIVGFTAGLRPYRQRRFRIAPERVGEKFVIHNYGHGGAGVTLSWGCAEEVESILRPHAAPPTAVAVLGAGVSGLTVARVLINHGYGVHLYADQFTPNTTSDLAGAQWAPAIVAAGSSTWDQARFRRILRRSHQQFLRLVSREYGVSIRDNYVTRGHGGSFRRIPAQVLPPAEDLERLPFHGRPRSGKCYTTLFIEPPIYLPRLQQAVRDGGAVVTRLRLEGWDEILALPEPVIVNCLGLGARDVVGDRALIPIRGQLVHLKAQDLPYLLNHRGYIFPRRDAVVLGGSTERNITDPTPDADECYRILRRHWQFFHDPKWR